MDRCPICKEYLFSWNRPHICKPLFYVWEPEGGETFTDAYDSKYGHYYASDAKEAAEISFTNDFERSECEVYVIADDDVTEILDGLLECDQTKEEIAKYNELANQKAQRYTVRAEAVREVTATLISEIEKEG